MKIPVSPARRFSRNGEGDATAVRYCPACGDGVEPASHFCAHCGADLHPATLELPPGVPFRASTSAAPTTHRPDPLAALISAPEPPDRATVVPDVERPGRRRWWIAVAALLVVVGGVTAYLLLTAEGKAPGQTVRALRSAEQTVTPAIRSAADASRLADVRAAGKLAAATGERLATQSGVISAIDDERHAAAATRVATAERQLMTDLARLANLSERRFSEWTAIKQDLQRDALALREARPPVVALQLVATGPLVVAPADIERAIDSVDGVIARADRLLRKWRAKSRAARARNRRATASLDAYADAMNGHLRRYDAARHDTSVFIEEVDSEGATFDEAYAALGEGVEARQNVKDAMSALKAPRALAPAQNRIVAVLGDATSAMGDAVSGLAEYQFDQLEYDFDYKSAPSWRQFEKSSDRIAGEYAAARSNWEALLKKRRNAIRARDLPPRPSV